MLRCTRKGWAGGPALGLFLLAPLIGEYLHGNMSVTALPWLVLTAPLYGGGALLVREAARRTRRGWPTVFLLGLAYAVFEEGLVTHTLFNPSYFGYPLLSWARLPVVEMGAWWTIFVLTLHVVWSISASIALAEALVPHRAAEPWLSNRGIVVIGIVFVLGAATNWLATYDLEQFVPAAEQLTGTAVTVVLLVVAAFRVAGRRHSPIGWRSPIGRAAPSPGWVATTAFVMTSVFIVLGWFPGWPTVAVYLGLYLIGWLLLRRWTRRPGWSGRHVLALTGGALATYAWYAFPSRPLVGAAGPVDTAGNVLFALGLVGLLWHARRATSMSAPAPEWLS
ncbi:hypothetical protein [Cryptosporangium aurantiacum]|uniref:Uncharacterized protein n=1 Tax=Cryptosporangium aurantiacum TaxID=134849 RepID=A0A1M7Q7Z5_9ACTN|nr:hypothetical protein [Cryptosporangium aurantiacum]SHN26548.1 hypothetical protein SAMN05443668_104275 [Cryptosporangium aurantiacum]